MKLNGDQKRLLAYAREHGHTFTSRSYQRLVNIDIYTASRDIRDLIRRGVVRLEHKGGRSYELVPVPATTKTEKPEDFAALEPLLLSQGFLRNQDIRAVLHLTLSQANRVARQLVTTGWLKATGEKRGRRYIAARQNN